MRSGFTPQRQRGVVANGQGIHAAPHGPENDRHRRRCERADESSTLQSVFTKTCAHTEQNRQRGASTST